MKQILNYGNRLDADSMTVVINLLPNDDVSNLKNHTVHTALKVGQFQFLTSLDDISFFSRNPHKAYYGKL